MKIAPLTILVKVKDQAKIGKKPRLIKYPLLVSRISSLIFPSTGICTYLQYISKFGQDVDHAVPETGMINTPGQSQSHNNPLLPQSAAGYQLQFFLRRQPPCFKCRQIAMTSL